MLGRMFKSLGSLIGMLAVYVLYPLGYTVFGGNPFTAIMASTETSLLHDDGSLFLAVLTIFGWACWAYVALGLAITIAAKLTGRNLRLPGFGPAQALAALMLAAITTTSVAPALSSARTVAAVRHIDTPPVIVLANPGDITAAEQNAHDPVPQAEQQQAKDDNITHVVQPRETLIGLAERYYDDSDATGRIVEANIGTIQPDGKSIQRGQARIHPGWTLLIPAPTVHNTLALSVVAAEASQQPEDAPVYQTEKDDNLWHIGDRYLGDPERYPEIAALNPDMISDPDLIQPGWQLTLPQDAEDRGARTHATGGLLDTQTGSSTTDLPTVPATPEAADDADPHTPQANPAPVPAASAPPSATPGSSPHTETTPNHASSPVATERSDSKAEQRQELHLTLNSGGWLTGGLVVALATVWFLVQRQRRRFREPQFPINVSHGSAKPERSTTIRAIAEAGIAGSYKHQLTGTSEPWKPATVSSVGIDAAGNELSLHHHLTGTTVLTGPANADAARAIIAATLASSILVPGPESADLIIDALTLTQLLGAQQSPRHLARLTITNSPEETIARLEREILYRSRVLAQQDAEDLAAINANPELDHIDGYVTVIPADDSTDARVLAAAEQSNRLGIAVVILGATQDGPTVHVQTDGFMHAEANQPAHSALDGGRIALLTVDDLGAILEMLTEADDTEDSDQAIATAESAAATPGIPGTSQNGHTKQEEADPHSLVPVRVAESPVVISLLGQPAVHADNGATIRILRPKRSLPILAYLASHPYHDHSLADLAFQLEPDSDQEGIKATLRTTITEIRKTLRNGTENPDGTFISQKSYRYRLDPNSVEVDIWRMHAHLKDANRAQDDETAIAALEKAVAYYRGDFATGFHDLWIDAKRTTYRNQITDALSRIAVIHEADRPEAALDALDRAHQIEEPYGINEPLIQMMMRIQGRLGRPDSVKRTMQQLRDRLRTDAGRTPDQSTERIYARMISREPTTQRPGP